MQLQETKDQRCLNNFNKYQKIWGNHEIQIEKHFQNREAYLKGLVHFEQPASEGGDSDSVVKQEDSPII